MPRVCEYPIEIRSRVDPAVLRSLHLQRSGPLVEIRARAFDAAEGALLSGYATVWDAPYELAGGPAYGGWIESVARGSVTKTLAEKADVRFLLNHDGLPLARTSSGTMTLAADDHGLRVDARLDPGNPLAVSLLSAVGRGDLNEMSFAFFVLRDRWSEEFTVREILEVELVDVSAVTYPANPATSLVAADESATAPPEQVGQTRGYPLSLARAQAALLRVRVR